MLPKRNYQYIQGGVGHVIMLSLVRACHNNVYFRQGKPLSPENYWG